MQDTNDSILGFEGFANFSHSTALSSQLDGDAVDSANYASFEQNSSEKKEINTTYIIGDDMKTLHMPPKQTQLLTLSANSNEGSNESVVEPCFQDILDTLTKLDTK